MNYNDLNDEMREHLNEKIAGLVESGLSESDARAQALREFGNRMLHLEESRAVWRRPSLDRFSQDLRYALRGMRRSPGSGVMRQEPCSSSFTLAWPWPICGPPIGPMGAAFPAARTMSEI
jgi:hypothetical protein